MPIEVACPTCETRFTLAESQAGKTVRCRHCAEVFPVPGSPRRREPARDRDRDSDRSRSRSDDPRDDRRRDGPPPKGIPGFAAMLGIMVGVAVLMLVGIFALVLARSKTTPPAVAVNPQPNQPPPNKDLPRLPQPGQNPPIQNPPVQNPPVQNPPIQNPPVQNPPVQNPPVEEPPIRDGLVGYWSCDDGQGNTAADFCQRSPATLFGARWAPGKRGGGLEFDGITAFCDLGQSPSLNFKAGDDITLSVWVKTDDTDGSIFLFRNSNDGGPILAVGAEGGKIAGIFREDNGEGASARGLLKGRNINDNRWHHILLTRDSNADRVSLFLDGQLQESKPARVNAAAGAITTNLRVLGCERYRELKKQGSPEFLHLRGTVDEVCLYKRLLTDAEVRDLLAAKSPPGVPAKN
jgi:predicted Zn finger-like uncharacterized protein